MNENRAGVLSCLESETRVERTSTFSSQNVMARFAYPSRHAIERRSSTRTARRSYERADAITVAGARARFNLESRYAEEQHLPGNEAQDAVNELPHRRSTPVVRFALGVLSAAIEPSAGVLPTELHCSVAAGQVIPCFEAGLYQRMAHFQSVDFWSGERKTLTFRAGLLACLLKELGAETCSVFG